MKALPTLALVPLASGLAAPCATAEPVTAPNIIFIMVDDMGYGDLGVYGQQLIRMPNIDQMAREGMRFTDVYAGSPVCAPARSVLMTGQHTGNTRIRGNFGTPGSGVQDADGNWRVPLSPEDVTVAEVLQSAGYVTGITGKWGLGEEGTTGIPNLKGFDEWYGLLNQRQAHSHYPAFVWRDQTKEWLAGNTGTFQDFATEEHYLHDLLTDFTLDFIERHAGGEAPFFLYLPYTIPHSAFQIPELEPYTVNTGWTQREKVYASMLTRMDRDVGRILDRLADLGIDGETLVFFCSDNGAADRYDGRFNSSGPLRGLKRDVYEGGIRTVMVTWWPGMIAPDVESGAIWTFADVLPTLTDAAGVAPPPGIDGVSVLPTLLGNNQPELAERPLYWEFHEGQFAQAIRMGRWKAVRQNPDEPTALYDLSVDIGETNNVAAAHPDIVAAMENRFITQRTPSTAWPTALDDAVPVEPPPEPKADFEGSWLPMNDSSGLLAADHSGLGFHASLHLSGGYPTWATDADGGYLQFDGAGGHLRVAGAKAPAGASPRTVAAWVRTSQPGALMSWGDRSAAGRAWVLRIDPTTGALRVEVQSGYIIGSTQLTNDAWHHVAAVFDPGVHGTDVAHVRLYVNGALETVSDSLSQTVMTQEETPVRIGGEEGRSDLDFTGRLRQVQWDSRAFPTVAIAALADPQLRHGERWHRIHFPNEEIDWKASASGSGQARLFHYAAGTLPGASLTPLAQIVSQAGNTFALETRLDARARIAVTPAGATHLAGPWTSNPEWVTESLATPTERRWTITLHGDSVRFVRLDFQLTD